jgi:ribosome-associated protein
MEEKIRRIAAWLDDKKGTSIKAIDLRGISSVTEAMLFATARSARHAQALAEELMKRFGEEKWEILGVEGMSRGQWILLDGNDVVVHIFQDETRTLFNIEGLYAKAPDFPLTIKNNEELS